MNGELAYLYLIQGLSATFHSADIPEWRPYPKLAPIIRGVNVPLRVSLPFLLFVRLRKQAFDTSLKQKSPPISRGAL